MKKTLAYALPLSFAMALAVVLLFTHPFDSSPRTEYEQFLLQAGQNFRDTDQQSETKNPAVDRPDMAAFMEFVKTLDPLTQDVPIDRRFAALEQTRDQMHLKSQYSNLVWKSEVADMGGRTRTLLFDPNDPNQMGMYAGSVTGGLWYNDNVMEGNDWMPINDFWPNLSISCMTFDPQQTETFYVGTGESETALIVYRESSGRGQGLYKSTDAGHTWELVPSTADWAYVTDLEIRVEDGISVIYAGVVSGIYKGVGHRSTPSDGLYRSTDGGGSWTQVMPDIPGTSTPFAPADICFSADNSRIFVGTTYGINSNATGNDRSGAASILYSDNGLDWTINQSYHNRIQQKPTVNKPGRVMVTGAPSDPNMIYAIIGAGYPAGAFDGYGCEYLLRSTDKGETWSELNFPANWASLAWHAFTVAVNPQDPDIIWLGGLDNWRSLDGGETWRKMSDWAQMYGKGASDYVHGDIHQILHRPNNGRELYIATDGGVFFTGSSTSPDNVTFHERNQNFNTLQYYTCAISPIEGAAHFMGGLQDNGTLNYLPNQTPKFTNMLSGGDGAYCFFDPDDLSKMITCSQYSTLYIYRDQGGLEPNLISVAQSGLGIFINPMDFDWKNNKVYLNVSYFDGSTPNMIAIADLNDDQIAGEVYTIGTQTQVPFTAIKWDETTDETSSTLFLGTAAGELYRLDQADQPGSVSNITGEAFPTAYLSNIEIGQTADTLLVTFSNYGVPSIFMSVDGGLSWRNLEGNLPDMPVRWAIFHPQSGQHIMLATETGIWITDDALAQEVDWNPNVSGMAHVRVDMLRVRKSDQTVVAASHGRGLFTAKWDLTSINGIEDQVQLGEIELYPNPTAGEFNLQTSLPDKAVAYIHDLSGRLVSKTRIEAGDQHTQFDIQQEPGGLYTLQIHCKNQTISKRLIKK